MVRPADSPDTTRVVFRRYPEKDGGDILAILLDVPANRARVTCYQHIGQHGEGDYFRMMGDTRPARPEEYASLKSELERIGYRVIVRKRRTVRF